MDTGKEPTTNPHLVLVNPVGGKGKAAHIYRSQIQPLFELAEAECNVVITCRYNPYGNYELVTTSFITKLLQA